MSRYSVAIITTTQKCNTFNTSNKAAALVYAREAMYNSDNLSAAVIDKNMSKCIQYYYNRK